MKMKVGNIVRDIESDHGEIGVIIDVEYGNELYVVHFSNSGRQYFLASELEVIK